MAKRGKSRSSSRKVKKKRIPKKYRVLKKEQPTWAIQDKKTGRLAGRVSEGEYYMGYRVKRKR
ncbi:MAG: hypothetical protein J7K29_03160 [Candidatus Cloacimonetes bacterium]|nr:hypothetical protein [Candidatus Cloacimonadota bacterium]